MNTIFKMLQKKK